MMSYIVDNLNKGARKSAPSASKRTATKRQAPKRGKTFLQSSPPVASPRPTTQEKSRMRNVVE